MTLTLIVGILLVLSGVGLILARHALPHIMHSGLKRLYGEPVADMVDDRFGPRIVVIVAIFAILLGAWNIAEYILLRF